MSKTAARSSQPCTGRRWPVRHCWILYLVAAALPPLAGAARRQMFADINTLTADSDHTASGEPYRGLQARFKSLEDARAAPVIVALKTHHFFGVEYARTVDDCVYTDGKALQCVYAEAMRGPMPAADALWFHGPSLSMTPLIRDAPDQLAVVMSMEGATNYPVLDNASFMDQFDVEMTYRRCSHVEVTYFVYTDSQLQNVLFRDPVPFEEKRTSIVYINSNCHTQNKRDQIVQQLMNLQQIPVDAWGRCLRNKMAVGGGAFSKLDVMSKSKFCIAMENSNGQDYVTEKIWHALDSGCLPIYLGAPNIDDFVPTPEAILDYRNFGTPEKLMAHLVKLSQDKEAYQATQRWRYTPLDKLSPGFRKMVLSHGSAIPHTQCQLCQLIMRQRLDPIDLKHTHCLRNATWLEAQKAGTSTWGPGSDNLLQRPHAHRWSSIGAWDPLHEAPMDTPRHAPDATVGLVVTH